MSYTTHNHFCGLLSTRWATFLASAVRPGTTHENSDTLVPSKVVNIRLSEELLQQIDEAASARGMDRSNWIRSVCIEAAARPSTDRDLVNRVNVIDERAREVMVDVIERVARLEAAVFKQGNDADPFSGK